MITNDSSDLSNQSNTSPYLKYVFFPFNKVFEHPVYVEKFEFHVGSSAVFTHTHMATRDDGTEFTFTSIDANNSTIVLHDVHPVTPLMGEEAL